MRRTADAIDITSRLRSIPRSLLLCILIGFMLTVVRFGMACDTPMVPNMSQVSDDLLLVQYADRIAEGQWLGAYTKMTLAKNPGYAFILLLPNILGISYQALFIALQACAALCFAFVAYDVSGGIIGALVAYLLLLYMPELFTFELFQRIYRMGIIVPFTISLFSSYIELYLHRDLPIRKLLPWALIAGFSLFETFTLKEDGVWVMPYVGVVSAILLFWWIRSRFLASLTTTDLVFRILILVLPIAMLRVGTGYIRAKNERAYGVSTTCERTDLGFSKFCSLLLKIEGDNDNPRAWVSATSLERAIAASPTLTSIAPEIQMSLEEWPDEPNGDLIFWVFRNAYEHAGGYTDGATTNAFWSAAAQELEQALDSGALPKKPGIQISALLPPVTAKDIGPTAQRCMHNLDVVLLHRHANVWREPGNGEVRDQVAAALLINGPTAVNDGTGMAPAQLRALDRNESVIAFIRGCDEAICVIQVLGMIFLLYLAFAKRYSPAQDACLFSLGLILSVTVLIIGVSMQTAYLTDFADWSTFMYSAGAYPLLWMTVMLTFCVNVRYVVERVSEGKASGARHSRSS
ncbi:MAG: hypothetical protein J6D34_10170 [Atopobiaceae bacterium]|nr:hypothetical protein [Atopobiaceae bacterium]